MGTRPPRDWYEEVLKQKGKEEMQMNEPGPCNWVEEVEEKLEPTGSDGVTTKSWEDTTKGPLRLLAKGQVAESRWGPLPNHAISKGQNTTKQGEGKRRDTGRLRYDLIPPHPLAETAQVYSIGAKEYDERNWEKGIDPDNCVAALMRHLEKWRAGETRDPEGQHHLASVVFWAFALMEFERTEVVEFALPYEDEDTVDLINTRV